MTALPLHFERMRAALPDLFPAALSRRTNEWQSAAYWSAPFRFAGSEPPDIGIGGRVPAIDPGYQERRDVLGLGACTSDGGPSLQVRADRGGWSDAAVGPTIVCIPMIPVRAGAAHRPGQSQMRGWRSLSMHAEIQDERVLWRAKPRTQISPFRC